MASPKGHAPYNKNGEGGRPPKFSDEQVDIFADEFLEWLKEDKNVWMKNFCLERDINSDCMSEWCNRSERFRGAYLIGKQKQEAKIFEGGLIGKYNSNIVKLALTNHHGWAERTESKISGDSQNPLQCIIDKVSSKKGEDEEDQRS